jgi:hypothetical protein
VRRRWSHWTAQTLRSIPRAHRPIERGPRARLPGDATAKIAERIQHNYLTTLHGGEVAAWHNNIDAACGRIALQGAVAGARMSLLGEAAKENWFDGGQPVPRTFG